MIGATPLPYPTWRTRISGSARHGATNSRRSVNTHADWGAPGSRKKAPPTWPLSLSLVAHSLPPPERQLQRRAHLGAPQVRGRQLGQRAAQEHVRVAPPRRPEALRFGLLLHLLLLMLLIR